MGWGFINAPLLTFTYQVKMTGHEHWPPEQARTCWQCNPTPTRKADTMHDTVNDHVDKYGAFNDTWMMHVEWTIKPHNDGYIVTEQFNDLPPMAPVYFDNIDHAATYIEQQKQTWRATRDLVITSIAVRRASDEC